MRLVAGALALILFASVARAEDLRTGEAAPAAEVTHGKVPFRVVRVMAQSHQALLFDRTRATHVLAALGATLDGYTVEAIDEDEVTLRFEGAQIVLAAPPRRGGRRHDRELPAADVRPAAGASQADTLAVAPTPAPTPVDPYGEVAIRVVEAPGSAARAIEAGEGGVRVAEAPGTFGRPPGTPSAEAQTFDLPPAGPGGIRVAKAPAGVAEIRAAEAPLPEARAADVKTPDARPAAATRAPDRQTLDAQALADVMSSGSRSPGVRAPAPAPAEARPAGTPPASSEIRTASAAPADTIVLPRRDVDGALGDFARLAAAVRGSFSASGLSVDAVGEGTIFQRAGLRAGDVITAVDGARLRSLDDAANLYARASTATTITAQIFRGGTPMTLHVAIQ